MRFKKGIFINCPNAYESPETLIAAMKRVKARTVFSFPA